MSAIVAITIILFAAIVPTLLYSLAFYWADRYEREPRYLILVAFLWGAIPATVVSLLSEIAIGPPLAYGRTDLSGALVEGVLVAPIIEELAKGAALFGLFIWKSDEFDGVLDGIIYGALIGFGFAMTENIVYFIGSYGEGGYSSLTWTIGIRSILFGLNHAFYTSLIGIGFGMARNRRSRSSRVLWVLAGLVAAISVHALHNFGITISSRYPIGLLLSIILAAGGVGIVIAAVLLSWKYERKVIRQELAEELGNLLTAEELLSLSTKWRQPMRRRQADQSTLMSLYVELAIRKRRLRARGLQYEESSQTEIEQLRAMIRRRKTEPDHV